MTILDRRPDGVVETEGNARPKRRRGFAAEMVQQLAIPTFVLDAEGRVIAWNRACEELTGMAAAQVLGTHEHWRAFYSEPRPCLADLVTQGRMEEVAGFYPLAEVSEDGALHAENWCLMPLRGEAFYLAIDAGAIRDKRGRTVAVIETLHDLTVHKRTEVALSLSASVFENSQEGILITDAKTTILSVNSAFCEMTGYAPEEVIGRKPDVLHSGLQDASFYKSMWNALRTTGRWHGEIWNRRKSGEVYPESLKINAVKNDLGEVLNYVGMFSDITDLKAAQERLENLANFDALTGLPNRVLLADRLHQALSSARRRDRLLAVCFLDLDEFKPINDQHGHEAGDQFLVEISRRLAKVLRTGDTVARLGGDEFVLLIGDLRDYAEMELVLSRILETVAAPVSIGDYALRVSASIGVAMFPLDEADPDTLIRHADQAMYQAKQQGRNRYQLFDMQAEHALKTQHQQIERIRRALQHGELCLHYQPKVNMRSGDVVGVEALLRWQHPQKGLVGPLEFLPMVEDTPLIIDIGEWVVREALDQMSQWDEAGLDISVSVNIAARHFQHIDFVSRLRDILAEYPAIPPSRLEMEILESVALEDIALVRSVMGACQALGVSFALDDFGTGYSSLSYLKRLPANTLKVDQSFVRDMLDDQEDLAIIEGVVGLARVFHMDVIAEGVETVEHGVLLMRFGCDLAQGYGISRPMPPEALPAWVAAFRPDPRWAMWANKEWSRVDQPLLLAQYDHIKWVQQVVDFVDSGELQLQEDELSNHHACRFGRWYDGDGQCNYGELAEFLDIEPIHREVHLLGSEIVRLKKAGDVDAARQQCLGLIRCKERILDKLGALQRIVVGAGA